MSSNARENAIEGYRLVLSRAREGDETREAMRYLGKKDLFFLLVYILKVEVANNDWCFNRCREFASSPDGHLDLWPRGHFKSTIITLAAVIQEIINDPEITIGIFSFNRPAAKVFLRSIKEQFERNELLKELYDDILYQSPEKEAPKWSEDEGIVVRRTGLPKEMTVEAWGLVDGQPIGRHFCLRVYDDTVTKDTCSSPEMIAKTIECIGLSFNLGKAAIGIDRQWFVGTRYHYADPYASLIEKKTVIPRLYAATKDGTLEGEPWLLTREKLERQIADMGSYVSACQLFNKPVMDGDCVFLREDIRPYTFEYDRIDGMNVYLLVDPANEKKASSDYSVFIVIGVAADRNYYLIDMVRDKLDLRERTNLLFRLHSQYRPIFVGYEKYGMQSDISHMEMEMDARNYRFSITPLGGSMKKEDRIKRLQPLFQAHRFYMPQSIIAVDANGKTRDYINEFINEEYMQFPYLKHDDMLDCMARICDKDVNVFFPDADVSFKENLDPWEMAEKQVLARTVKTGYHSFDYIEETI